MSSRNFYQAALVTAAIAGLMPLAALAADGSRPQAEEPHVVVNYADLDITSTRGAEKLYLRIQAAAASVCPQVGTEQLQRYRVAKRCQNDALARAVSTISSPQLAAVYAARTHRVARSQV